MLKQQISKSIADNRDVIVEVNDKVWEYAETAFDEVQTTALYMKVLKELGFEAEENVAGIPTAFLGRYGSGKPVVGILAEYDALSGLSQEGGVAVHKPITPGGSGQGCGHNCLGAGALAAAIAVKDYLQKSGKPGTVILFGTPGEEGGSGKAFMAREGVFDECDLAITWHPGHANMARSGSSNANYQVSYKFKGVSAHAAGAPHLGRSALDAVELMNVGVQFLREHIPTDARVHYAITNTGGYSPNVVQPEAEVLYLIRSPKTEQVAELYERVNDIARGAALMTGTTMEIDFVKACSNIIPNNVLERQLYKNMTEFNAPTFTDEEKAFAAEIIKSYPSFADPMDQLIKQYGNEIASTMEHYFRTGASLNEFVLPYYPTEYASPGSSDVADVSWVCPTAQITAVTTAANTPGHSWQFTSCNKTSIAHKGVIYAGEAMAGAIVDVFEDPSILEAATAEFKKRVPNGYKCPIPAGVKPRSLSKQKK